MVSRLLNWVGKHLVWFVVGICLAEGWYGLRAKQKMHTRAHFTIGYITGGTYRPKSGRSYSYYYRVKDKEYEATDISEAGMNTENGARFVVEYNSLEPEVSTGHFTLAVPDSIREAPTDGWRKPPVSVPQGGGGPRPAMSSCAGGFCMCYLLAPQLSLAANFFPLCTKHQATASRSAWPHAPGQRLKHLGSGRPSRLTC